MAQVRIHSMRSSSRRSRKRWRNIMAIASLLHRRLALASEHFTGSCPKSSKQENRLKHSFYLILLVLFAGCYSFTGASIPAHLNTVGIPLATDNSGFGRSEMRQELTEFLTQ